MIRGDMPDVVYRTEKGKFQAVVDEIAACHQTGQPVLVGTISIENSEMLSKMLERRGVPHQVLNAKYHEKEAEIVSRAGQHGMVTIATNMAGRGTDIVLGDGVKQLGGLHIIGTERHESRRIDNQLRGRAGRQGDPGSTRFYISLEDDLMRLFGSENIMGIMDKLGMDDSIPVEAGIISRSIETAQRRVEARNFEIRKHVLEYDDVMNQQREVIYAQRRQVLMGESLKDNIVDMLETVIDSTIAMFSGESQYPEEWDLESLLEYADGLFLPGHNLTREMLAKMERDEVRELFMDEAQKIYANREEIFGPEVMREIERAVMLQVVDSKWMDHLDAMDQLREGIGLRAYGQKDPLVEYKFEAYDMFTNMIASIQEDFIRYVLRVSPAVTEEPQERQRQNVVENRYAEEGPKQPVRAENQVGRNDPCPCGSGKKYKKCCGATR